MLPSKVRFDSTVPLGAEALRVIRPLSVVPVKDNKPLVPEVPLVPDVPAAPVFPLDPEVPEVPAAPVFPLDPEVPEDPSTPLKTQDNVYNVLLVKDPFEARGLDNSKSK